MKKILVIFFSFILMSSFFIYGISAQDEVGGVDSINEVALNSEEVVSEEPSVISEEEISEEEKIDALVQEAQNFDEQLSLGAGITPDSPLYFVDNAFDGFSNPADVREEKISEMLELAPQCGQGDQRACENMQNSFERYQRYADKFEKDVSPEERDKALESSKAIRGVAIRDIAQNVPAGQKDEFVRDIVLGEENIATAAEIAGKIKELCEQLSKLDPSEYSRVCSAGRDAPDWRKNLDIKLTEEQREEALKFGEIMSQCFESSGQNCRCEEIPFSEFAETCSVAAPLATACDIKGDEEACNKLDNLEMPELPDYLQDIMDELEGGINEDKYGMFLPPECEEAGVKTPKECAKIMIQEHAPEECKSALLAANVQNEREGREICEKIMFEQNAPEECIDAGITDPQECGKIMFAQNAPPECVDAGITGEGKNDPRDCQKLMESEFRSQEPSCAPGTICVSGSQWAPGTGPNIKMSGRNCAGIQDSQERLACYDGAGNYVQEYQNDFEGKFGDTQNQQRQCAESCIAQNSAWDFSNGNCVCKIPDFQKYEQNHIDNFRQDFNQPYNQQYGDFKQGQYYPPQGQPGQFQPPEGFVSPDGVFQQPPQDYQQPSTETTTTEPSTSSSGETSTSGGESSDGGSSSGGESSDGGSSSGGESSDGGSSSGGEGSITGGVISNNKFLSFRYR